MKIAVIIPAAGQGKRFGADSPDAKAASALGSAGNKIELDLGGRPVFLRTIELFLNRADVGQIVLAVNPDQIDNFRLRWGDKLGFHDVTVAPGGRADRWETVLRAMEAVEDSCTHVAVHDAVRPLASKAMIDRVFEAAEKYAAVVPAVAVNSTLKRVEGEPDAKSGPADPLDDILGSAGKPQFTARPIIETVDRSDLMLAQTPQVFEKQLLGDAYAQVAEGKISADGITDDASLIELLGQTVYVVEGESTNIKITRPADVELVVALMEKRQEQTTAALAKKRLFADDDE